MKKKKKLPENEIVTSIPMRALPKNTIFCFHEERGTLSKGKKEVGSYGVTMAGGIYIFHKGQFYTISISDVIDGFNEVVKI